MVRRLMPGTDDPTRLAERLATDMSVSEWIWGHRPRPARPAPGSGTRRHGAPPRAIDARPTTTRRSAHAARNSSDNGGSSRSTPRPRAPTRRTRNGSNTWPICWNAYSPPRWRPSRSRRRWGPVDPRQGRPRLHDGDVQRARPRAHARQALPSTRSTGSPSSDNGASATRAAATSTEKAARTYGTEDRNPFQLLEACLDNARITVTKDSPTETTASGKPKRVKDQKATMAAIEKGQRDPRRVEPMGVQGPRPRAKAHRPVQPQIQRHAAPPRRRILPDHARHHPRRRPASASEGRGGPRPAQRRGHPHRARRRSRQDVRGASHSPTRRNVSARRQADARGPQPPRGPVGRRRAQALSGQPNPRHGQGRATQPRIGETLLGPGRQRRLGCGDRAGEPVQPAARQQGTTAEEHARPRRRVRPGRRGRRQGQGRQGPHRQTAGGGAQKRRDRHAAPARRQGVARRQGTGGHQVRNRLAWTCSSSTRPTTSRTSACPSPPPTWACNCRPPRNARTCSTNANGCARPGTEATSRS